METQYLERGGKVYAQWTCPHCNSSFGTGDYVPTRAHARKLIEDSRQKHKCFGQKKRGRGRPSLGRTKILYLRVTEACEAELAKRALAENKTKNDLAIEILESAVGG